MKLLLPVPLLVFAGCVTTQVRQQDTQASTRTASASHNTRPAFVDPTYGYQVARIDSLQSVYLIYARRSDTLFKIISDKAQVAKCQKLQVGGRYKLQLRSLYFTDATREELAQYPIAVATAGHLHSAGINWDGKGLLIKMEGDSIQDLYYARNLTGLCLQ